MLVPALEGHRLWAESYDTSSNPLLALESRLLQDLFPSLTAMRVVDVACGTGRWTARFQDKAASVFGVDICEEMLRKASSHLHGHFALGRAECLPLASCVADLTICSLAVGYFCPLDQAISEMARITRRGGSVIIADLHPEAVAAGWKRSFRADGRAVEIEHFQYSLEDFIGSAERAGLRLAAQMHGYFGEPERPIFETARRPERFAQVAGIPAIWIGSWQKT